MFCKIKKNKGGYAIYLCDRKRVDGKVISNDIKIGTYGWHSLYGDYEDTEGLDEDIPMILARSISRRIKPYDITLMDVVEKLEKAKEEYYPIYKEIMARVMEQLKSEEKLIAKKKNVDYEKFKVKYQDLYYKDISEKYQEGYLMGQLSQMKSCSVKNTNVNDEEKKLLKEAFKLLSHKHHPDKGGSTETMAMINNLKEKIL